MTGTNGAAPNGTTNGTGNGAAGNGAAGLWGSNGNPNLGGNSGKSQAQPDLANAFDLGEWDFGAANIVASELPPRGWLLGNWLCRQFVSALIGDGAAGKTATRLACALALATGRGDIVGEHVFERVPVLFLCFEDGETELKRRVCAAMLEHGISNADITGYLFVRAITNSEIKLAIAGDYNKTERGPLRAALDAAIIRRNAGAVFLDPLVKTHAVNENSNKDMDFVIEILADLAIERDVAVDTPHHVSKGAADPGNADRGRGASAVKDGGRLVYTLTGMSKEASSSLGIDEKERRKLVRIDQAKVNIVEPTDETRWLRLVGVPLGNTWDPRYPKGDSAQTVKCWQPPDAFEGMAKTKIAAIFEALRAGPGDGEFYSFDARATYWAGEAIQTHTGKPKEEAHRILRTWLIKGVLLPGDYYSPKRKKKAPRATVNETMAREILGALYRPPAAVVDAPEDPEGPPGAEAPKPVKPAERDKYDIDDRIFAAIERGVPAPTDHGGDGEVRYYSLDATSEHAAWRVVKTHRPDINSTGAQAMIKQWLKDGILLAAEEGLRLHPLTKQLRAIE
jgi:hypothetical protein